MSNPTEIASRLRAERERLGIKQGEMARLSGISRGTQLAYETGASSPAVSYMNTLSALGVDVHFVMTGVQAGTLPYGHVSIRRLNEMDTHDGMQEIVLPDVLLVRRAVMQVDSLRWAYMPTGAMEPSIPRGAILLIDPARTDPQHVIDGNTYAYGLSGRSDVRRILFRSDHWSLSGPPGAGRENRDVYNDDMRNFNIHGEVVAVI